METNFRILNRLETTTMKMREIIKEVITLLILMIFSQFKMKPSKISIFSLNKNLHLKIKINLAMIPNNKKIIQIPILIITSSSVKVLRLLIHYLCLREDRIKWLTLEKGSLSKNTSQIKKKLKLYNTIVTMINMKSLKWYKIPM